MKKFFAIIALIGVMLQTFNQVVIVAQYYAQKDYIAKNLCENRNNPKMHCDGKCCLKKKLAKQGKEQAPASGNQKNETVTLFFTDATYETPAIFPALISIKHFIQNESAVADYQRSIFHPPASIV